MNPVQICDACGRQRDCLLHQRAEHPPTAARKWLLKTCTDTAKPCAEPLVIHYRAGIS